MGDRWVGFVMRTIATLVGVMLVCGGLLAAPAGAGNDTTSGDSVAKTIRNEMWPDFQDSKRGRKLGVHELALTEVECPAEIPWGVKKRGRAFAAALIKWANQLDIEEPSVSVDKQGFFTCTASLDDQTLLLIGAINATGAETFNTYSGLANAKVLKSFVERRYERQRDMKGTASCGPHSVIVTTIPIPGPTATLECKVQGASGEAVTASVTIDDNDKVSVTFSDDSGG